MELLLLLTNCSIVCSMTLNALQKQTNISGVKIVVQLLIINSLKEASNYIALRSKMIYLQNKIGFKNRIFRGYIEVK